MIRLLLIIGAAAVSGYLLAPGSPVPGHSWVDLQQEERAAQYLRHIELENADEVRPSSDRQ